MKSPAVTEFLRFMQTKGIVSTEPVLATGSVQRFHIEGDNPAKKNGWAILHLGEYPHGYFGSWRTGEKFFWQFKKPLTPSERKAALAYQAEIQAQYQAEQVNRHSEAAETATNLFGQASTACSQHPYLQEKQVMPYGIREIEDALLVPMSMDASLQSLQTIYPDGSKRFLNGGRIKGCCFVLDNATLPTDGSGEVIICEGFATGATLKLVYPKVVCAFTAGNLIPVAQSIRVSCPTAEITIAADNDQWTEGNPGLAKARLAAGLVNAVVMWPNFNGLDTSTKPTDFNDFVRLGGRL